jgi:hypothetical protein
MKIKILIFTAILFFSTAVLIKAQTILSPGGEKVFTNDPATGGESGDNGNFIQFNMNSEHDPGTKTLKAQVFSTAASFLGTGEAYSLIYYDFQISQTPETQNNTVGAWINYNAFWQGYQEMLATLGSNAYVKVEMNLRNLTSGQLEMHEVIHDLDMKTYSFKIITAGFNFDDSGSKTNTIPVVLRRGNSYRLHFKLTATLYITSPSIVISACDYMDGLAGLGNGRVELRNLYVKVGLDEKETLQKLAQIDSLESRIDTLEYRLENHYHTYLTGRGVGHNNTEASTTLSIFEAYGNSGTTPPVFDAYPVQTPEEGAQNKSVPDDYSVGQNFPNPFNPITKISFAIPEQEFVTVKVFDILGRQIEVLMNETRAPGYYAINFNGDKLPSGTYIYEIRAGSFVETKKMILLK